MLALFCLGGRSENGLGQAGSLNQALRQLDTAHGAVGLVLLQAGTGEEAAGHALEGQHIQLLDHHRAAKALGGDALIIERAGQVVGEIDGVEEELRGCGQHAALVRDGRLEGVVVGRDAVRDHHQKSVLVYIVDIADLAGGKMDIRRKLRSHDLYSSAQG